MTTFEKNVALGQNLVHIFTPFDFQCLLCGKFFIRLCQKNSFTQKQRQSKRGRESERRQCSPYNAEVESFFYSVPRIWRKMGTQLPKYEGILYVSYLSDMWSFRLLSRIKQKLSSFIHISFIQGNIQSNTTYIRWTIPYHLVYLRMNQVYRK